MEKELNLNLTTQGGELVIRHGAAPELLPPVKPERLVIQGDFKAVSQYLKGRVKDKTDNLLQLTLVKDAIIFTDKKNLRIVLDTNPNNPLATKVVGTAEKSEELKLFGINTGKSYRRDELFKLVRMNKALFFNPQQHNDLLTALKAFKASTSGNTQLESDLRGNKNLSYQKEVTSNMPETFTLNIPIIKGEPKEVFSVDICIEESEGTATFSFESPELNDVQQKRIEEIFDRELLHCDGFVVVNV